MHKSQYKQCNVYSRPGTAFYTSAGRSPPEKKGEALRVPHADAGREWANVRRNSKGMEVHGEGMGE